MKIGIFDSGIGGVTVLLELLKFLPNEQYVYYSDSANNPYGNKSKAEIIALSQRASEYLLEKGCEILVVACNTASAEAADILRQKFPDVPIYAIQPAIKAVYDSEPNPSKPSLALATHATLNSKKFQELCLKYPVENLQLIDCNGLAELIEAGDMEGIRNFLANKIGGYKNAVENIVLGCTHYPLVADEIRQTLGNNIKFFNGAKGLARNIYNQYQNTQSNIDSSEITFYDTAHNPEKEKRFKYIVGRLW